MVPLQPTQEEAFTLLQFGLNVQDPLQKDNNDISAAVNMTSVPPETITSFSTSTSDEAYLPTLSPSVAVPRSIPLNTSIEQPSLPATATTTMQSIPATVATPNLGVFHPRVSVVSAIPTTIGSRPFAPIVSAIRTTTAMDNNTSFAPVVSAIPSTVTTHNDNRNSHSHVTTADASSLVDQALTLENSNTNVFQSDPDNPFWSIPASINWTDWNEWYQHTQDSSAWDTLNG